jgi:hypothetical protein
MEEARTGLAFENQRNNPLPEGDGKFYLCWPILYFLGRNKKLFFWGSRDCHNRMRKEKLQEYSLVVTKYSLMAAD